MTEYDPVVAEILGFDPGSGIETRSGGGTILREVSYAPTAGKEVPSDIALEFERRMKSGASDDQELLVNGGHLCTVTRQGAATTRTYFNFLPGKAARIQRFTPVQEMTFERQNNGTNRVTGLTFNRPDYTYSPWTHLRVLIGQDRSVVVDVSAHNTQLNAHIHYTAGTGLIVYLNNSTEPKSDASPESENGSGYKLYHDRLSSLIIPERFPFDTFQDYLGINPDLQKNPYNALDISDKEMHRIKDPFRFGAMMLWTP